MTDITPINATDTDPADAAFAARLAAAVAAGAVDLQLRDAVDLAFADPAVHTAAAMAAVRSIAERLVGQTYRELEAEADHNRLGELSFVARRYGGEPGGPSSVYAVVHIPTDLPVSAAASVYESYASDIAEMLDVAGVSYDALELVGGRRLPPTQPPAQETIGDYLDGELELEAETTALRLTPDLNLYPQGASLADLFTTAGVVTRAEGLTVARHMIDGVDGHGRPIPASAVMVALSAHMARLGLTA